VKDLSIIEDRDLKNLIIVDNSIISFAFNLSNGVPIKAFVGEGNDEELLYMVTFLEEIFAIPDVRPYIDKTFRLREIMNQHAGSKVKKSDAKKLMNNAVASLHAKDAKGLKEETKKEKKNKK